MVCYVGRIHEFGPCAGMASGTGDRCGWILPAAIGIDHGSPNARVVGYRWVLPGDAPQLWWGRIHDLVADQTVATRIQSIWSVPGAHRRLGHWLAQRTWWSRLDAAQQQALVMLGERSSRRRCRRVCSSSRSNCSNRQERSRGGNNSKRAPMMWRCGSVIRMQLPQWRAWFKQNMGLVVPIALDSRFLSGTKGLKLLCWQQ